MHPHNKDTITYSIKSDPGNIFMWRVQFVRLDCHSMLQPVTKCRIGTHHYFVIIQIVHFCTLTRKIHNAYTLQSFEIECSTGIKKNCQTVVCKQYDL